MRNTCLVDCAEGIRDRNQNTQGWSSERRPPSCCFRYSWSVTPCRYSMTMLPLPLALKKLTTDTMLAWSRNCNNVPTPLIFEPLQPTWVGCSGIRAPVYDRPAI